MKRVIGIGGIFFQARDPEKLAAWYKQHLGIEVEDWGGAVFREGAGADLKPKRQANINWSPFEEATEYFKPSEKPFMINYRVQDLDALLAQLRKEGVAIDPKPPEKSEFGYFAWVMDPEGNRIELWEPPEE
jgi:predicted enzyme related to lactoylglutathione lyase